MKKLLLFLMMIPFLIKAQDGAYQGYKFKIPQYTNTYNRVAFFDTKGYLKPIPNGVGYLYNNNGTFSFQSIDLSGYATQSWVSSNFDNYAAWYLYGNSSLYASVGSQQSLNFLNGDGITVALSGTAPLFGVTSNLNLAGLSTIVNPTTSYYVPVTGGSSNTKVTISTMGGLAAYNAIKLYNYPISSTAPTTNQVLQYNGSEYVPTTLSGSTNYWQAGSGYIAPATITNEVRIGSTSDNGDYKLQVSGRVRVESSAGSALAISSPNDQGFSIDQGSNSIITQTDGGTNNVGQILNLSRVSTGSASSGFGASIDFSLAGTNYAAKIETVSTSISPLAANLRLTVNSGGGYITPLTANPDNSVTISDIIKLVPRSSAPSSPSEGWIYVNSTDHHIYCYLNGTWKQLDN